MESKKTNSAICTMKNLDVDGLGIITLCIFRCKKNHYKRKSSFFMVTCIRSWLSSWNEWNIHFIKTSPLQPWRVYPKHFARINLHLLYISFTHMWDVNWLQKISDSDLTAEVMQNIIIFNKCSPGPRAISGTHTSPCLQGRGDIPCHAWAPEVGTYM